MVSLISNKKLVRIGEIATTNSGLCIHLSYLGFQHQTIGAHDRPMVISSLLIVISPARCIYDTRMGIDNKGVPALTYLISITVPTIVFGPFGILTVL